MQKPNQIYQHYFIKLNDLKKLLPNSVFNNYIRYLTHKYNYNEPLNNYINIKTNKNSILTTPLENDVLVYTLKRFLIKYLQLEYNLSHLEVIGIDLNKINNYHKLNFLEVIGIDLNKINNYHKLNLLFYDLWLKDKSLKFPNEFNNEKFIVDPKFEMFNQFTNENKFYITQENLKPYQHYLLNNKNLNQNEVVEFIKVLINTYQNQNWLTKSYLVNKFLLKQPLNLNTSTFDKFNLEVYQKLKELTQQNYNNTQEYLKSISDYIKTIHKSKLNETLKQYLKFQFDIKINNPTKKIEREEY